MFRVFDFTFLASGASRCGNGRQIVGRDANDDRAECCHSRCDGKRCRFVKRIVDGAAVEESTVVVIVESFILKSTVSFEPFDPGLGVGVFVFFVVFDIVCTVVIILRERRVLVLSPRAR